MSPSAASGQGIGNCGDAKSQRSNGKSDRASFNRPNPWRLCRSARLAMRSAVAVDHIQGFCGLFPIKSLLVVRQAGQRLTKSGSDASRARSTSPRMSTRPRLGYRKLMVKEGHLAVLAENVSVAE